MLTSLREEEAAGLMGMNGKAGIRGMDTCFYVLYYSGDGSRRR